MVYSSQAYFLCTRVKAVLHLPCGGDEYKKVVTFRRVLDGKELAIREEFDACCHTTLKFINCVPVPTLFVDIYTD